MVKIALVQLQPVLGDKSANIELIRKAVASTDAPLVIFPEMFLTGYMVRDKLQPLAETLDGLSVRAVCEIARSENRCIIVGMPEKDSVRDGILYNSAVVVQPDGSVGTYHKMHLVNFGPFEEYTYFAKGARMPLFDTPAGKVGIIICFDIFFPELCKYYALEGADMIVCISASPSVTREFFEKVMVARAIENTVFFAYVNFVGPEKNLIFWGGDALVSPRGDIIARGGYYEEGIVEVDVDLKELEVARQFRPTIRESREDVLRAVCDRFALGPKPDD